MTQGNFEDRCQEVVLPLLLGFPHDLIPIGSAFVIRAMGSYALLATARHNFEEMYKLQNPHPRYHPSMPSFLVPRTKHTISLDVSEVFLPISNKNEGKLGVAKAIWGYANHYTDFAILLAEVKPSSNYQFKYHIALDPSPLHPGELLMAAGYKDQTIDSDYDESSDTTNAKFAFAFQRHVGEVLPRQSDDGRIKWPAALTNIPLASGMSGGPVLRSTSTFQKITARGIICRDSSDDPMRMSDGSGTASFVTELWPALLTPVRWPDFNSGVFRDTTLLELMDAGHIQPEGNVLDEFHYLSDCATRHEVYHWGTPRSWLPTCPESSRAQCFANQNE